MMRLGIVAKATALFAELSETLFQAQYRLEPVLGRRSTMHTLNRRQCLGIAAAGAFVALTAVGLPARADELVQHLGPVPPHEPILTTFGNKRVIAFYEPDNGRCAVNAIVYDKTDADTGMTTAARVRVSLNPRQMVHIDSTDNKSINLQCGDRAEMLALVDNDELVAFGVQQANPPMRASASGF
jgi:hypothetical protein